MDTAHIVALLRESIFMIATLVVFLVYAMAKGRYALINLILALYLALLVSVEFPYYRQLSGSGEGSAVLKILVFLAFVVVGVVLMRRHIPGDDFEAAFHGLGKKLLLAALATILVMAFSFHALPVTEIIHPGTPIQALFAPSDRFFWWLAIPLGVLLFI
ncbi:MAG TPA: hypothetical protein VFS75_03200 [Candidatus Paceibacterota bacterium]|nr:hypothetical protein [Candidatus Paceibacterota bacterium]